MNTITFELCTEDRARLDAIISGLSRLNAHNCSGCVESAVQMAVEVAKNPDDVDPSYIKGIGADEHPAEASTAHLEVVTNAPDEAPKAPEEKPLEFAKFQGLVSKVIAEGKCTKPQLREHMAEYTYLKDGKEETCTKLSDIPEAKRVGFLAIFGVQP